MGVNTIMIFPGNNPSYCVNLFDQGVQAPIRMIDGKQPIDTPVSTIRGLYDYRTWVFGVLRTLKSQKVKKIQVVVPLPFQVIRDNAISYGRWVGVTEEASLSFGAKFETIDFDPAPGTGGKRYVLDALHEYLKQKGEG